VLDAESATMTPVTRHYDAAGAVIAAPLVLADLCRLPAQEGASPDVRIRSGAVPEHLEGAQLVGPAYEANETSFLLNTPQLRCRVDNADEVIIDAAPGTDPATVETLLLGAPLVALCYQRGLMPLSATAVEVNGAAVAFVGASGSGKSTVGAFLARRGYALLSDDLLPVLAEPHPTAYAYRRRLRMWRDVLDVMGLDHRDLDGDRPGLQRYRLEPPATAAGPLPLRRLYMLGAWPDAPPDNFERLGRIDALGAVVGMLVLPALWSLLNEPEVRFQRLVSLVGKTEIVRWTRTLAFDQLGAQLDALEADMKTSTA
jgi:hypothetical protein